MDQEIGRHVMVFARAGIFSEEPTVLVHKSLYSGGLQLSGRLFDRPEMTIGVAYAYLDGIADSPGDVRDTRVWEAYARWNPSEKLGISLDVQHIADELRQAGDPSLWAIGMRAYYAP
jgi:porin